MQAPRLRLHSPAIGCSVRVLQHWLWINIDRCTTFVRAAHQNEEAPFVRDVTRTILRQSRHASGFLLLLARMGPPRLPPSLSVRTALPAITQVRLSSVPREGNLSPFYKSSASWKREIDEDEVGMTQTVAERLARA